MQSNKISKLKNGCRLGKYEILNVLGQGGNGVVYLAKDTILGKKWAIKQVLKDKNGSSSLSKASEGKKSLDKINFSEEYVNRNEEALVMRELDHPGIPRITEQMEDESFFYIVMDYCKGESLWQLCNRKQVTADEIIDWGIQLCDILNYLHGKNPPIIFCDMKPGNVICDERNRLKLVDFGIAKTDYYGRDAKGTRGFAAPEQHKGKYSIQSDVYNLGATLLWCMKELHCGTLRKILKKAMAQEIEKRYRDCHLLKKKLLHLQKRREKQKLRSYIYVVAIIAMTSVGIWENNTQVFFERLSNIDILLQNRYEIEKQRYIENLEIKKESLIHNLEKLEGGTPHEQEMDDGVNGGNDSWGDDE